MTMHMGHVPADSTLYIPFATYGGTNGESITLTGLAVTDIEVYKDGSATQRASDNGYALLDTDGIDFDSVTGIHGFSIDLSDNSDAGFYAVGSQYWVVVSAVTIDSQTVNFIAATFRIVPAEASAGVPDVNVASMDASTVTASAVATGAIDADAIAADAITAAKIAADAIGASELAADAVTEIQSGLATAAALATVDGIVDDILVDTAEIGAAGAGLTAVPWNAAWDAEVQSECNDALVALNLDHLMAVAVTGTDVVDNSVIADLVSASATSDYDDYVNTTDSLQAIRDRGDSAWITGGGGGITDIINIVPAIPISIDLADTASWRVGFHLTNALDDLPSTAEITPGTCSIHRKAIGGTSWSAVVTDGACSESAGLIYIDEVFDNGTGYAEGDSIRFTFKSQKVTVAANDYEITDATGVIYYSFIRETERGTDSAATAAALGSPVGADISADIAAIKAETALIVADTNELQTDWADAGRLDAILDARASQASVDTVDSNVDAILVDTGTTIPATLGTPAGADMAADIAAVKSDTAAVLVDTGTTIPGTITTVDTNVDSILSLLDDARTEPGQGAPPVNPDLATKIDYLYKAWRNKKTQTATTFSLFADDASTVDQKATVSDDGTTTTVGEQATGP